MQQRHPIAEYLDILEHELKFDVQISRRVRKEIEDHLWEAAAHEPAGDPIANQRRAIERLGSPRRIASQYVALSLLRRTQRVGTILILVSAAVFVTMKVEPGASPTYDYEYMHSTRVREEFKVALGTPR